MFVLNDEAGDVEYEVAAEVGIVQGVDVVEGPMLDHLLDSEWVRVVTRHHADAIHGQEGPEDGSTLNDNVVVQEVSEDAHHEGAADVERPVATRGTPDNLICKGVVKDETQSEPTPACQHEGAHLRVLLEDETEQEAH